jgi:hypothetical protein
MFEPAVQSELDGYLATLEQELLVQGFSAKGAETLVEEARAHLEEALECAEARTASTARQVLVEFGSAKRFATTHAQAMRRPSKSAVLWPCLVLLLLMALHNAPLTNHLWHYATISLIGGSALIFWFALTARKPIFTGLIACACGFLVVQTAWNTTFATPDQFIDGWTTTVPNSSVAQYEASLKKSLDRLSIGLEQIDLGSQVFTQANRGKPVPAALMYQGAYWSPEGIRELDLGLAPNELSPQLRIRTWDDAVSQWSATERFGAAAEAKRVLISDDSNIGSGLANLAWVKQQSLLVRCALMYVNSLRIVVVYLVLALFAATLGRLAALFGHWIGVERRRNALSIGLSEVTK